MNYIPVLMIVDWGNGECETPGRMYITDDGNRVFADGGGWCTQYVKKWEVISQEEYDDRVLIEKFDGYGGM